MSRRQVGSVIIATPLDHARRRYAAVVFFVAVAAYAPAMRNLYTLDDGLIFESRADRASAPLATLFDGDYFSRYKQDTYRPTATLTSIVDHRIGFHPIRAGHAQNILWHAGTSVLVSALAAPFLPPIPALVAGLTFAVHPAATEAALSIGYREDALVAFLVTAALVLTLRGGAGRRLLALMLYALALFAKENAIVLPALLVLARLIINRGMPPDRRAFGGELALFALVSAGYLVVRFGIMASPQAFADSAGGTYRDTLVAVPRIFAHYLRLLIVPWPLIALYAHMFPFGASWFSQLPWLLLDAGILGGIVWLARAHPALGFGLLWFTVAVTPVLHFVPMRVASADRFMYLPLVGGALAAGALFALLQQAARRPAAQRIVWVGALAALLGMLTLTENRIPIWHDDLTLWNDTLRHNNRAYLGRFVRAAVFKNAGQADSARRELEIAVADCPRESRFGRDRFCANYASTLGFERMQSGDLTGARAAFNEAVGFTRTYVPAIVGLGSVSLAEGDLSAARRSADLATIIDPLTPYVRAQLHAFVQELARAERERDSPGAAPSHGMPR
jgi:hypothetical protein